MNTHSIHTLCVHGAGGARDKNNTTGAIAVPIYQSATFSHPGVGESTGYDYSRSQNPTREVLEQTVAALERGTDAIAFSTGMAALAVLCELFSPGDHMIASGDLYGGSVRFLDHIARKNGVAVDYLHTGDVETVKRHIRPDTRAIFVETPTNPTMRMTEVAAVAALAKEHTLLLIVDNTFFTPVYQNPLVLGADVVLHSGTKYLGGHNDTLAGFLVTGSPELAEKLRFLAKTIGACLAPFDCFLILRGIKTLALRMERITENAQTVAAWLSEQPKVKAAHYAGKSGMISFEVDSAETAKRILSGVRTIVYAESLGGVESLITYPVLQTHADVPEETRSALGITDRLLRLSVGIEAVEDILADLEAAIG